METLKEWDFKLKLVKTKRGAVLYLIEISPDHFFIEQNPLKDSKYGYAYRKLKEKYPEFYMFWEIKNNRYTGRLLAGAFLTKKEMDQVITDLLKSDEFMRYEEIMEQIEE
ncbi:MAG: hypothetical protein GXO04_04990 [Aquificae bacterium]|nr:hypothetical protein [Aquificota bacterium]